MGLLGHVFGLVVGFGITQPRDEQSMRTTLAIDLPSAARFFSASKPRPLMMIGADTDIELGTVLAGDQALGPVMVDRSAGQFPDQNACFPDKFPERELHAGVLLFGRSLEFPMLKKLDDKLDPKAKGAKTPQADFDRNRDGLYGGLPKARDPDAPGPDAKQQHSSH
jgi:hypothetical protein